MGNINITIKSVLNLLTPNYYMPKIDVKSA